MPVNWKIKESITLVDDEDYSRFRDCAASISIDANGSPRAYIRQGKEWVALARAITGARPGQIADHINRNTLDNRRSNLRACTPSESLRNRGKFKNAKGSKYKGVRKLARSWQAMIRDGNRTRIIGRFASEIEAARAYDIAAMNLYGAFACTNGISDHIEPKQLPRLKPRGLPAAKAAAR